MQFSPFLTVIGTLFNVTEPRQKKNFLMTETVTKYVAEVAKSL